MTDLPGLRGKTALVTGGNAGIGFEMVRALAAAGARVTFTARDAAKGAQALDRLRREAGSGAIELLSLDLADLRSVRACAAEVQARHPRLDLLLNNAGVILSRRQETAQGFETTFGVNHLGHFLLTNLLLTNLLRERLVASAPARIVTLASGAHRWAGPGLDFDDLQSRTGYRAMVAYGRSKLANILFTRELARRLDGTGVTANAVHPGVVRTDFTRDGDTSGPLSWLWSAIRPFLLSPAQGARVPLWVATAPELEGVTGQYYPNRRQPGGMTAAAQDDDAARRLWDASERLIAESGA